jgi:hypothetical protein
MNGLKKQNYQKQNGILEIKYRDENYNTVYSKEVNINDKGSFEKMLDELTIKGLRFPNNWFKNANDKTERKDKEQIRSIDVQRVNQ